MSGSTEREGRREDGCSTEINHNTVNSEKTGGSAARRKFHPMQAARHLIQLVTFLLFPGLFTTFYYAFGSIWEMLLRGTLFSALGVHELILAGGFCLITLLAGRYFCGFLCSFGAMQDLIWFAAKKCGRKKSLIGEKEDRVLKWGKYAVLLFIAVVFWTFQFKLADMELSPWNVFGRYTALSGWTKPTYLVSIGGVLLLLIMVSSFLTERFFCRYLCPLGAIASVFARFRFYRLKKDREGCGSCRACTRACSMGIGLSQMDRVDSGECIQCMACTENCPRGKIHAAPSPWIMMILGTALFLAIAHVPMLPFPESESSISEVGGASGPGSTSETGGVSDSTGNVRESEQETINEILRESEALPAGTYQDGEYTGSGTGFRGETKVSVTVENGKITKITILSHEDDEKFFSRAESVVPDEIIAAQSAEVDAVSGATFSSNSIREAVADALGTTAEDLNVPSQDNSGDSGHTGGGKHKGWQ